MRKDSSFVCLCGGTHGATKPCRESLLSNDKYNGLPPRKLQSRMPYELMQLLCVLVIAALHDCAQDGMCTIAMS